jgi:hypothetical protein
VVKPCNTCWSVTGVVVVICGRAGIQTEASVVQSTVLSAKQVCVVAFRELLPPDVAALVLVSGRDSANGHVHPHRIKHRLACCMPVPAVVWSLVVDRDGRACSTVS